MNLRPKFKKYIVALSGGMDSVVLLHHLVQKAQPLRVVHIHHHLSKQAADWADFCQNLAEQYQVPYRQIDIFLHSGTNLEKRARDQRYQALFSQLKDNEILCTAHHQLDQAETFFLQSLRGAGVAGLAAMPQQATRHHRPLLNWSKQKISHYATQQNLRWIEDDSNKNTHFRRNFLRSEIIPQLKTHFPSLEKTLGRSVKHQAEALQLLHALAQIDIEHYQLLSATTRLIISRLTQLNKARLINVLRYVLKQQNIPSPNAQRLDEIYKQLIHSKPNSKTSISWQHHQLRTYQDEVYFIKPLQKQTPCPLTQHLAQQMGIEVRYHQPTKRVILANKRHSQSLKKLYQERGIPPWQRPKLARYYQNNQLIAIERLGYLSEK